MNCPVCGAPIDSKNSCRSCGFRVLGGTARFKPLDSSVPDIPVSSTQKPSKAFLHAVNGPQRGAVYQLGERKLSLGRDPNSDIFLNDMTVSRRHATIVFSGNSYCIRDCNSFNGLWVNNQSVEYKYLVPGDKIQLGAFTLVYKEE